MHIIIPMSGSGQRFIDAGYQVPKPLIEVDGMPIIEHVCNLFPGESKFTFICNTEHLANTEMRAILQRIKPTANIVAIPPHKFGPVFAVSKILDAIDDDEEVIVNYCDFSMAWDYEAFLRVTRERGADGAIPAYRHFHPHMLGSTNYAFMREQDLWMQEIREKQPFTENRMEEFASTGTYYFRHGRYLKKYFQQTLDEGVAINGEFYVSVVFNYLVADKLKVSIFEIEHMLQWGTPEDLAEYQTWSNYFAYLSQPHAAFEPAPQQINLIPMAGWGSRFSKENYTQPKPLIPVMDKPMVVQAALACPSAQKTIFVCLEQHLKQHPEMVEAIQQQIEHAEIKSIPAVTEGQAVTCALGLAHEDENASVFIAACDNSMVLDKQRWLSLKDQADVVVFTFKNQACVQRNPKMYGYVKVNAQNVVDGVSVKIPLSDQPQNDHAIVGAFYFKSAKIFNDIYQKLINRDQRINNEYYVDSMIGLAADMGYCVKPMVVDYYICWGTPNDLRTFQYWERFFHQCPWHKFSQLQTNVNKETVDERQLSAIHVI